MRFDYRAGSREFIPSLNSASLVWRFSLLGSSVARARIITKAFRKSARAFAESPSASARLPRLSNENDRFFQIGSARFGFHLSTIFREGFLGKSLTVPLAS